MRLSLDQRKNADAMLNAMRVLNGTVDESKQGIILATTDIGAGVDVRTALTDEDSTGGYDLFCVPCLLPTFLQFSCETTRLWVPQRLPRWWQRPCEHASWPEP